MCKVLRSACLYVFLLVCLFVCLPARIYQKPFVQISKYFLYMLPVGMAQSSNDNVISYVLPVLWITSCFYIWCINSRLVAVVVSERHAIDEQPLFE